MRLRLLVLFAALLAIPALAADVSGTWQFSVDLDGGGHGDPTFVLKQAGAKITGTFKNPQGESPVTGTLTGNAIKLERKGERDGQAFTATYAGKLDAPDKMSGTVTFSGGGGTGKWTATRKATPKK
jgi:hypothetical protein